MPLSATGLGGGAASLFRHSGGGTKTLAEVFGVNKNSSTDVRVQNFTDYYTASTSYPNNTRWAYFPHSTNHNFFCSYIHATNDNDLGPLISFNGTSRIPGTTTNVHTLAPNSVPNWGTVSSGYTVTDMLNTDAYSGAWCSSYNYLNGNTGWFTIRFSSGLQDTLGLVLQGYSANHQSMLLRVVCNNVVKFFVPKGDIFTSAVSTSNVFRYAYYPTKAPTNVNNTNYFDGYNGNAMPASIFE